jgi:hypothetical protein
MRSINPVRHTINLRFNYQQMNSLLLNFDLEDLYLRSHSWRSPVQIVPVRRPDEIHAGQLTAAQ